MTYVPPPQQPHQPPVMPGAPQQPPAGWGPTPGHPPEPAAKSRLLPILLGILVLAILAVAGLIFVLVSRKEPDLTQAGAERACRTAFGREWKARAEVAADDAGSVIASVQNIELMETWKTASGYSVNATIHYTLTTGILNPVEETLDLTCAATGSDAAPATTVTNRG